MCISLPLAVRLAFSRRRRASRCVGESPRTPDPPPTGHGSRKLGKEGTTHERWRRRAVHIDPAALRVTPRNMNGEGRTRSFFICPPGGHEVITPSREKDGIESTGEARGHSQDTPPPSSTPTVGCWILVHLGARERQTRHDKTWEVQAPVRDPTQQDEDCILVGCLFSHPTPHEANPDPGLVSFLTFPHAHLARPRLLIFLPSPHLE